MKKKTHKIIICISLFIMLFVNFGNVFGATNPDYTPTINVSENALDAKIKDSILLDTLANMINAIASLAESLIGTVFKDLTGDNVFPWADRIIFNGIAFLDINFLNPSENSLFGSSSNPSILGEVVRQVYSSIFSLAVLFLGVAVGVMAIRLAIASIAAEKAKYKKAIVNWATCIVMLFLMHYILAFVFWINEQMVRVASGILIQTIEDKGLNSVDFTEALNEVVNPKARVTLFCETAKQPVAAGVAGWLGNLIDPQDVEDATTILLKDNNVDIANRLLTNTWYVDNRLVYVEDNAIGDFFKQSAQNIGQTNTMVAEIGLPRLVYDVVDAAEVKNFLENSDSDTIASQRKKGYYQGRKEKLFFDKEAYLSNPEFIKDVKYLAYCYAHKDDADKIYAFYRDYIDYRINTGDNPNKWQSQLNWVWAGLDNSILDKIDETIDNIEKESFYNKVMNDNSLKMKIAEQRVKVDEQIISAATGVKSNTTDIIANLGQFFKQSAYVYTSEEVTTGTGDTKEVITGWRASKVSVTGALLYAIFIFQSCLYFITYVKRLFYVIMLSMFGPIVVIYDFFMKSAS